MNSLYRLYGPMALVTGASSGIGLEFARQLAQKGFDLCLVARRRELLESYAKEIGENFGVKVIIISLDLTLAHGMSTLEEKTKDLDIGLIIPNAGIETNGHFLDISMAQQDKVIELNCKVPVKMANVFGQRFKQRQTSAMLFVSSVFAYQAVPYFANYAASKAYILNFAEALSFELSSQKTDITVLSPGLTNTAMPENINMDFSKLPMRAMEVTPVVQSGLKALVCGKLSVVPGTRNKLMSFMSQRLMGRKAISSMFGKLNKKAMA